MFTISIDKEFEAVTLSFKNEYIEFECCPEDCDSLWEHGYDSYPSNGEFNFSYLEKEISFSIAKHGDGQGGQFSLTIKMTKDIRDSLEKAMKEWRDFLADREQEN